MNISEQTAPVKSSTLHTIENQLPQVFDRRKKPTLWPDDLMVLRGDMDESSNDTLEDDLFAPLGNPPELESPLDPKTISRQRLRDIHDQLSQVFGSNDFPGALASIDEDSFSPPTDCYAFYLPWHHFPEQTWGIYLLVEGIEALGRELGRGLISTQPNSD